MKLFARIFAAVLMAWLTLASMGASEERQPSEPSGANMAPLPPASNPPGVQDAQATPIAASSGAPSHIGTNSAEASFDSSTVSIAPTRSSVDGSNLSIESHLASRSSADGSRQSSDTPANQNPANAEGLAEPSALSANAEATHQSGPEPNSGKLNFPLKHMLHICAWQRIHLKQHGLYSRPASVARGAYLYLHRLNI